MLSDLKFDRENLVALYVGHRLSQEAVAKRFGISRASVQSYLRRWHIPSGLKGRAGRPRLCPDWEVEDGRDEEVLAGERFPQDEARE